MFLVQLYNNNNNKLWFWNAVFQNNDFGQSWRCTVDSSPRNEYPLTNKNSLGREGVRTLRLGHTRRRPEGRLRRRDVARRDASRRDARRHGLPQSALRRTGDDHEGRGSAAASRRRASRRDATTSARPSVESFSPRPHVDWNTRPTSTRCSVRGFPPSSCRSSSS